MHYIEYIDVNTYLNIYIHITGRYAHTYMNEACKYCLYQGLLKMICRLHNIPLSAHIEMYICSFSFTKMQW